MQLVNVPNVITLARALLGKRLDDEVTVETPGGGRTFAVTAIDY